MIVNKWYYDIESYNNFFSITAIPFDVDQRLVNAYVACDIARMEAEKKGLDTTVILEDKQKLMKAMGVKQFVVYDSQKGNHINQLYGIYEFFIREKTLYGYNSTIYDKPVLNYVIYNAKKYGHNLHTMCVDKDKHRFTADVNRYGRDAFEFGAGFERTQTWLRFYKRKFIDRDLMKILYLDKTFTGLKAVAITLKWYRIQELPIPFDRKIKDEEVPIILDYNLNDVLITLTLGRTVKKELDLRDELSEEFDIDLTNQSRSSIGKSLSIKYYELISQDNRKNWIDKRTFRSYIKVRDILAHDISFKSGTFNQLLASINQETIRVDEGKKFNKYIRLRGKAFTMAKGGLHSIDLGAIFDNTDGYMYVDADVTSYYPNGILKLRASPEHLVPRFFFTTVHFIKDTRVLAKHNGEETKSEGLKIAINRMYGGFNDPKDPFYDPLCTYKVTINLQLYLLMLIERLELAGFEVISANTDGIVTRFKPDRHEEYKAICKSWEEDTSFELEFSEYERYMRKDVNNYIAIKKGFKDAVATLPKDDEGAKVALEKKYVKRKGRFIYEANFAKGFAYPVVSKAVNEYLIYGTDYKEYIRDHINKGKTNIYDYCISQKVDKSFDCVITKYENGNVVRVPTQQYNRFYVTTKDNPDGALITKVKGNREISLLAKTSIILFNNYFRSDDYKIDYNFYIRLAWEILFGKQKTKKRYKRKDAGVIPLMGELFNQDHFEDDLVPIDPQTEEYVFEDYDDSDDDYKLTEEEQIAAEVYSMISSHLASDNEDLPF